MSFSEKMRESLGAEGVRLKLPQPEDAVTRGTTLHTRLTMFGGTRSAHISSLMIRIVEADRHWVTDEGERLSEEDALALPDRRHLTAGWDRRTVAEQQVEVDLEIRESGEEGVDVSVEIPTDCQPTAINCAHTLNIQADIKGQIDPTQNARIVIAGA